MAQNFKISEWETEPIAFLRSKNEIDRLFDGLIKNGIDGKDMFICSSWVS